MTGRARAAVVVGLGSAALVAVLRSRRRATSDRPAVEVTHPPRWVVRAADPVMRRLLSSPRTAGRMGDELLLVHVTGRRTGRTYDVPVGCRPGPDGRLVVVTHGRWRVNLRDLPDVEVTWRGLRRPARAELVEDPQAVAEVYRGRIDPLAPRASARRTGLRLAHDRVPATEEVVDAVRRAHVGVVRLDVGEPRTA
ncbi:nitroreductase/quinone reductase family protein [Cellulomonas fimi]|uniref:DUF385 domain-containing protein n=1 Tax=Cellulomonas fimi (strain ATCC 484 / DSM 20113 / JCM 1341 / CCUG 24087 / LMG 16345 / NBRC 15513 / NCIMB 8980 / NCTC 7547 / NRS-133) TaxID=590998 RepID=F4GZI5_CELFA|nr:nitroreductase/quinone reductase family protein [Cellulomonas fimi]AEE44906.1 hypothetical protein Celf_0766 [Cellulomonas fimi ATCC 484]NNH08278.1 nitroreductase family deazaflavin-dependent oxidoreductase [Cellulomonas fimi]VEH27641.1 deazaflavin-dependent oxidoreductase, nitroreductase family [Cellulomonas fimi]